MVSTAPPQDPPTTFFRVLFMLTPLTDGNSSWVRVWVGLGVGRGTTTTAVTNFATVSSLETASPVYIINVISYRMGSIFMSCELDLRTAAKSTDMANASAFWVGRKRRSLTGALL
jgi:hypothetical protein